MAPAYNIFQPIPEVWTERINRTFRVTKLVVANTSASARTLSMMDGTGMVFLDTVLVPGVWTEYAPQVWFQDGVWWMASGPGVMGGIASD